MHAWLSLSTFCGPLVKRCARRQQCTSPTGCTRINHSVHSNQEWGYRDTDAIEQLAKAAGFKLVALESMPANNYDMIFAME